MKYKVMVGEDVRMTFDADLTQAAAPIFLDGDITPFQTADGNHMAVRIAKMLNSWVASECGGSCFDEDENWKAFEDHS